MLKHILVTLDSARYSEYVLAHAQSLAQASEAKITIMRLIDSSSTRGRRRIVDPVEWHIRKMEVEASLNNMAQALMKKGLSVTTTILEGSNADQLIQYVQANEVDLVILTKQSESVSDLVHAVMKQTSIPVVVLPVGDHLLGDMPQDCYKKILVPLDGSQRAEITLPIATVLAQKCNSQLLLAHVVHKPEMPRHAPPSAEEIELVDRLVEVNRADAIRYLEEIVARMPGDVQTRLLVSDNIPATLHRLVEQENVGLIVLSAHGYSGEPQWAYGSITNHIIAYSTKPILVVQDLPMTKTQQIETRVVARTGKA